MSDTRLNRTYGGNATKGTISWWIKRSGSGSGFFYKNAPDGANYAQIQFDSSDRIECMSVTSSAHTVKRITKRVFKDVGSWYHFLLVTDFTNATAAYRMRIYVNGVEIPTADFEGGGDYANGSGSDQNNFHYTSGTNDNCIGATTVPNQYFDGYMAQVVIAHDAVLTPSDFGSTDATTGEWKPKSDGEIRDGVTFGSEGCLLSFENSSYPGYDYQTSDRSGTTNDYTKTGSGLKSLDNPSNSFATINSLEYQGGGAIAFVKGNLGYTHDGSGTYLTGWSSLGVSTGKWYCEVKCETVGSASTVGFVNADVNPHFKYQGTPGQGANSAGYVNNGAMMKDGSDVYGSGSWTSITSGDIVGLALDLDNGFMYWAHNNTWQNSGDPTSGATGTGGYATSNITASGTFFFGAGSSGAGEFYYNFGNGWFNTTAVSSAEADGAGQGQMEYAPPTDYKVLCTKNIKTYG
tara:strand:+ start:55 stop:1440 length:1386 start_codon:yes stop_codon:yes gene_type:complete